MINLENLMIIICIINLKILMIIRINPYGYHNLDMYLRKVAVRPGCIVSSGLSPP